MEHNRGQVKFLNQSLDLFGDGMILDVIVTLSADNYTMEGKTDFFAVGIRLLSFYLLRKRKWSVPKVIITAAALGLISFGGILSYLNNY